MLELYYEYSMIFTFAKLLEYYNIYIKLISFSKEQYSLFKIKTINTYNFLCETKNSFFNSEILTKIAFKQFTTTSVSNPDRWTNVILYLFHIFVQFH